MSDGNSEMNSALQKLLRTGEYSDLTIKCGQYSFPVHKAVICPRSEYFATACKPGTFKEGRESVITLQATTDDGCADDIASYDPEAVKLMIEFLYHHDYEAPAVFVSAESANERAKPMGLSLPPLVPSGDCNVLMHAKMYTLGSKYMIESLKAIALQKFTEAVKYAWNHPDFIVAVRVVYTTTPHSDKGLREVALRTLLDHSAILSRKDDLEACICSMDGLAYEMFRIVVKRFAPSGTCSHTFGGILFGRCISCGKEVEPAPDAAGSPKEGGLGRTEAQRPIPKRRPGSNLGLERFKKRRIAAAELEHQWEAAVLQ